MIRKKKYFARKSKKNIRWRTNALTISKVTQVLCFASPPSPSPPLHNKTNPLHRGIRIFPTLRHDARGGQCRSICRINKKLPPCKIFCHQITHGPCKLSPFFRDADFHWNKTNKSCCDSPLHNPPCCSLACIRQRTCGWRRAIYQRARQGRRWEIPPRWWWAIAARAMAGKAPVHTARAMAGKSLHWREQRWASRRCARQGQRRVICRAGDGQAPRGYSNCFLIGSAKSRSGIDWAKVSKMWWCIVVCGF